MNFFVTVLAETCGVLAAVHRCNVLLTHVTQGNLRVREEIRVRKRKEEMEVRERKRIEKNEESERGGVYPFSFIFVGIILKLY